MENEVKRVKKVIENEKKAKQWDDLFLNKPKNISLLHLCQDIQHRVDKKNLQLNEFKELLSRLEKKYPTIVQSVKENIPGEKSLNRKLVVDYRSANLEDWSNWELTKIHDCRHYQLPISGNHYQCFKHFCWSIFGGFVNC